MLLLHLHPRMVPEQALALPRTFGLGGMALVLFLLLTFTGGLLLFAYEPSPERAYGSLRALIDDKPFGAFVRNAHHWAATGLLVIGVLHMLRVFFTGAHLPPRRANWYVGLALLGLIIGSNFTGYLLPWDQLAYWAITIATGMLAYVPVAGDLLVRAARGDAEVGAKTLAQYFVLHVALLPLLMLVLASYHFWLVRKAGGVILPRAPQGSPQERRLVPVSPHLLQREGVAALVILAAVMLTAAVANAPLLAQANAGMSPNPAKAPWYFMGVQELLIHIHPTFAVLVVPALVLGALLALPSVAYGEPASGRYFQSPRGARATIAAAVLASVVTPLAVVASEWARRSPPWMPSLPAAIRTGVAPLLLMMAALGLFYLALRRFWHASKLEATQATAGFAIVSFLVLTIIGALFRGQGMALGWPWTRGGSA